MNEDACMKELDWHRLLGQIRDGYVVPVIGSRLLVGGDNRQSLQRQIAIRLLEKHDVQVNPESLPPFREVNDVVSRLKAGTNLQDLYADIHEVIQELTADEAIIPAPIQQLAQISDFRLIVTLTPDDMLARSLRRHCAVNEIVHSPKLTTSKAGVLPVDWHTRKNEVQLLYLFGKSSSAPIFAIHDEDLLEYAHSLIACRSGAVSDFLNELQERRLLLIGCNFPDWLSRFFLRVISNKRLAEKSQHDFLIDAPEESFTCFLRCFVRDTEILSHFPPVDFIAELHKRWKDTQKTTGPVVVSPTAPHGVIFFISYSRCTDLPRAEAMKRALIDFGVAESEIWFDKQSVEPGNDFRHSIIAGIRSCRYFLPLLSESAVQRREAFVFREWFEAADRMKEMRCEFVIPVIVDADYDPNRFKDGIVNAFKQFDFGHAPGGNPDARTAKKLKSLADNARQGKD